ncbi:uncharacterized protein LOC107324361 [Coturnix japonica]|uniref:uncharacterized protein LOC107324361 n=1 Tax=Coturnix japonica TaxID=93934 RepID=UPI00077701CA|nr:uncharacterized protein LOC107324361 [Coturnix japonica]
MARDGAVLLGCVLLVMAGGLQCCRAFEVLMGKQGELLSFPALRPVANDIVRILWMSKTYGTHIAEAKPGVKEFAVNFLPKFQGRLRIHLQSLSLEITELHSTDEGLYSAVVDTASNPSSPRTFSYSVKVLDHTPWTTDSDTGGHSRSTTEPGMSSESHTVGRTTLGPSKGQVPDAGGAPGLCGAQGGYCTLKGYLIAAVFGPLVVLLVAVHVVTRH